jgi:hypothetical protein
MRSPPSERGRNRQLCFEIDAAKAAQMETTLLPPPSGVMVGLWTTLFEMGGGRNRLARTFSRSLMDAVCAIRGVKVG